ncbi:hypothetical protein I314_02409 [Cryptococcus bacillisporus CA1873]|uniref:Uncharacterized protein n=1 Tax=Cryptococcus bacillisporus CA1873 TaxID=1296111 RepID=A0ABR5BDE1_CRYGA|nr:hypothetical protein I314_02409 [Cryptococcus bacillisporus CA1873]|eukprot:KIR67196.1 hypothetical protein I314_02409 [Cryptococcus gattii CA1873]
MEGKTSARTLEFTSQIDMDEPLPDRSRTPTIQLRPLPIPTRFFGASHLNSSCRITSPRF